MATESPLVFCRDCGHRKPDTREDSHLCELNPKFVPTYLCMTYSYRRCADVNQHNNCPHWKPERDRGR